MIKHKSNHPWLLVECLSPLLQADCLTLTQLCTAYSIIRNVDILFNQSMRVFDRLEVGCTGAGGYCVDRQTAK